MAFMNSMKTMKGADKDGFLVFGLWVPGQGFGFFCFVCFFVGGVRALGFRAQFFQKKEVRDFQFRFSCWSFGVWGLQRGRKLLYYRV